MPIGKSSPSQGIMNPGALKMRDSGEETMKDSATAEKMAPSVEYYPYPSQDDALYAENRVYQKDSNFSLIVPDVSKYVTGISDYFLSIDGKILNSNLTRYDKYTTAYLTVKVPVEKFDEANQRVTTDVKKIFSQSINAYDRTGNYTSSADKLELLKEQKAQKEIDLLSAYTEAEQKKINLEIQRLDRQIATAEKQLQNITSQIDYASMNINITDSEKYYKGESYNSFDPMVPFERAWNSVKSILGIVFYLFIWTLVFGIVWLPLILIIIAIKKLLLKKKTRAERIIDNL